MDYQVLAEVYANVRDFGAKGDGVNDDTSAIHDAVVSGVEVLFPAGQYLFRGELEFGNVGQCFTFLSGAVLVAGSSVAFVHITASSQVFDGLAIEAPRSVLAHSPLLEVGDNVAPGGEPKSVGHLIFRDLWVSVFGFQVAGACALRVRCGIDFRFMGGQVSGPGISGTTAIWLTHFGPTYQGYGFSPNEIDFVGLRVSRFGWACRIDTTMDEPTFIACSFVDNLDGGILVSTDVRGTAPTVKTLRFIACRFENPDAAQQVQVDKDCQIYAGVALGCTFGPSSKGTGVGAANQEQADARCIFRIGGLLAGFAACGCASEAGPSRVVWALADSSNPMRAIDMFNDWAEETLATGTKAADLAWLASNDRGELTVGGDVIRLDAEKIGLLGVAPVEQSGHYTPNASLSSRDRRLRAGNGHRVLAQLLLDLQALGLLG